MADFRNDQSKCSVIRHGLPNNCNKLAILDTRGGVDVITNPSSGRKESQGARYKTECLICKANMKAKQGRAVPLMLCIGIQA